MSDIIKLWKVKYPDQTRGKTDREIALAIAASDPAAVYRYRAIRDHVEAAKMESDRSNGAAFDSATARRTQERLRNNKDRGFWSTYLYDPIKRGALMAKESDLISSYTGPKETFTREDAEKLIQIRKDMEALPVSEHFREMQEAVGFNNWMGEFLGLRETPLILGEVGVESFSALFHHGWGKISGGAVAGAGTALALGQAGPQAGLPEEIITVPVGAKWGSAVGMGKTSFNLASTGKFLEVMEEASGRSLMDDPQALLDAASDPEIMKKARSKAIKKGLPIGILDMMSMGLAGRAAAIGQRLGSSFGARAKQLGTRTAPRLGKEALIDKAVRLGYLGSSKAAPKTAEFLFQGGMGAAGETLGQLASEGKVDDWKSVFLEGVAEFGMAPVEITAAHLTRDMSPEHSKVLNDRINSFRLRGVTSDEQKAQVDVYLAAGELNKEASTVYKDRIDELYRVKNEDENAAPENEKGAVGGIGKKNALKAINDRISGYGATTEAPRPSQVPQKSQNFPILVGPSEKISAYRKADGATKAEMVEKGADGGGIDIVTEYPQGAKAQEQINKGWEWAAENKKDLFAAAREKQREARAGAAESLVEGGVNSWADLGRNPKGVFGNDELTEQRVAFAIDGIESELVEGDQQTNRGAAENFIDGKGKGLGKSAQEMIRQFAILLDDKEGVEVVTETEAPFTPPDKDDPNQLDMFRAVEAKELGEPAPEPTEGSYRTRTGEFIDTGKPIKVWRGGELVEEGGPVEIWRAEKPVTKTVGEAKGEAATTPRKDLSWIKTKKGEVATGLSEMEQQGFEQPEWTIEQELQKRDRESAARIEEALAEGPVDLVLETEVARRDYGDAQQVGGEKKEGLDTLDHPLFHRLKPEDFPVSEYGLWAVPSRGVKGDKSIGWGKRWNAVDPKTGKYENITYFEGARRAALKLANKWSGTLGTEAYDFAWGALVGYTTWKQGSTTTEGVEQFRLGMFDELRRRVQHHADEAEKRGVPRSESVLEKAVILTPKKKKEISGKAILSRNFYDQERSKRRENARIQSAIGGRQGKKRLSSRERKRRSRTQIAVAGGEAKNVMHGGKGSTYMRTSDEELTEGDYSGWQGELAGPEFKAPIAFKEGTQEFEQEEAVREAGLIFDGEEFVEAEENLEGANLESLDLIIEQMHGGSAEIAGQGSKKIRAMEATKIAVRKFLGEYRNNLINQSPRGGEGLRASFPWYSLDQLNHDIYVKVIIPAFAYQKDWNLRASKGLPKVEAQISEAHEEIFSLQRKLKDLDGTTLDQIISRISFATSGVSAGTLYTEEALAEQGMSPETRIVHTSLVDSHVEKFIESGLLPKNAKTNIKVKLGGMGQRTALGRPRKKIGGRRPTWAKGKKGWELGNWVSRRSDLYIKDLSARKSILEKELWRLQVQRKKLLSTIERSPRGNLYSKMRDGDKSLGWIGIKGLVRERNKRAEEHNLTVDPKKPEELIKIFGETKDTKSWTPSGIDRKKGTFTNYRLEEMLKEMEWRYKNAFNDAFREFQQIFHTREDLRTAFDEVGLFSELGGEKGRPYVDMYDQNSLIVNGGRRGNLTMAEALDAAIAPLLGADRARAKRFHPLIKAVLESKDYNTKVFLASIDHDPKAIGAAFFDPFRDQVIIDPTRITSDADQFDILMEEFVHSFTFDLERRNPASAHRLDFLRGKVKEELDNRGIDTFGSNPYFLRNNQEFLAHAISNPEITELLRSIDIQEGMTVKNVFNRILDILKEALGLTAEQGTVLEEVAFHLSESVRLREAGSLKRFKQGILNNPVTSEYKIPLRQFHGKAASVGTPLLYTENIMMPEGSGFVVDSKTMVNPSVEVPIEYKDAGPEWDTVREQLAMFAAAALHGTPNPDIFNKFSTEFMGEGEGNQAFGWGLYFATSKSVAEHYKNMGSRFNPMDDERYQATYNGTYLKDLLLDYQRDAHDIIDESKDSGERLLDEWIGYDSAIEEMSKAYILQRINDNPEGFTWKNLYTELRSWEQFEAFKDSGLSAKDFPWDKKLPSNLGSIAPLPNLITQAVLKDMSSSLNLDLDGRVDWVDKAEMDIMKSTKEYIESQGLDRQGRGVGLAKGFKAAEKSMPPKGRIYEVILAPAEDEYLLLDENRAEQSAKVSKALNDIEDELGELLPVNLSNGMEIYEAVGAINDMVYGYINNGDKESMDARKERTSLLLLKHGIRGNKYLEGAARGKGKGNYNYVIFDAADIEITAAFAESRESRERDVKVDLSDREKIVLDEIQSAYEVYERSRGSVSPLKEPAVNASWIADRFDKSVIGTGKMYADHGELGFRNPAQKVLNSLEKKGYLEISLGPSIRGRREAKLYNPVTPPQEQTAMFAESREGMADTMSGSKFVETISAKTEVPASAKTEVENKMTTWDKFKEALVSAAHPWDVFQKIITKTPMQTSLAHLNELQAGAAPKADLDVQMMERDIEGIIGTNKKRVDLWEKFVVAERIKSRLEDQQTKMGEVEGRLSELMDDSNWMPRDDAGERTEFDVSDANFTQGKDRAGLEMELIQLLAISKEVAPWKNIESFRPDYNAGLAEMVKMVNDPELLSVDENGNAAGKFVDAQEKYHEHMESALLLLYDSGLLTPKSYGKIQSSTSFYVPFYVVRYFNKNPEDTFGQTIKGIREVGETIVKPLDAGKFKIYYSRLRAERNLYIKKIDLFRSDFDPEGNHIAKVDSPEDIVEGAGKGVLMFYEGGEQKYISIDKKIADLSKRFDPVSASQVHMALKLAGDLFKMGATGVNFFFQLFNFALFDPVRLLTTSKAGIRISRDKGLNPWFLAQQYLRAMMAASWANLTPNSIKNLMSAKSPEFTAGMDELYKEFVNSGAAGSTIAEYFHKPTHIKDALTGASTARKNPLTMVTAKLSQVGKTLEQTAKMVGMQRMMGFEEVEKLKSKIDKTKDAGARIALQNQLDEKMDFIATEIRNYSGSPDFLRQGKVTKNEALNVLFLFFNARIQGVERDLSRLSKVFSKDSQARGEALGTGLKLSAFAVVPTIWAWSMNRRDKDREEEYDEISENDKKHYIHIPLGEYFEHPYIEGKMVADYIRIPRRESFGLFSYTIEKALDWYYEKDPKAVSEMVSYWIEGTMPVNVAGATEGDIIGTGESVMSNLNPLLKAPIEVLSGRNFFRHKPLVPQSLARADPAQQYYESTPEIYKEIGGATGLGALRIQHIVNGLSAGLITQFTPPKNVGIDGGIGRSLASTPLISRLARSTFLEETELDEILNDVNMEDATARVLRRRRVDKFMERTRGMSIQERARRIEPARNNNEVLVNQAIIRRLREEALGLEPDELRLKNSSSNARASVIIKKLRGKNPAEVKVYLTDLASKKILTQDVANYIREKLQQRGETIQDYVTEPVR